MASLWMLGGDEPVEFEVSAEPVTIGRSKQNTIQIRDPSVSKLHARIVPDPDSDAYRIDDLDSSNGTYVDGIRITSSLLAPGAQIRIGTTEFRLNDSLIVDDTEAPDLSGSSIFTSMPVIPPGLFDEDPSSFKLREIEQSPAVRTSAAGFGQKEGLAEKKLRLIQLIGEKLIQTMDVEQLATEILTIVVNQTKADRGFLCLFDKKGAHIPLASKGLTPGEKICISRTVLSRLMEEKSGVLIKQVSSSDDGVESLKAMKVESTLCVPLWTSDKIMGFISLDITGKTRSFTKSHLELLIAIAHQAAIGIERGRLAKKATHEERVRAYLGQYLDVKIVKHITDSADGTDPLAPAEREVTVLFSDIVAFTKISEGLKPIELADFIRDYLTAMTEIIFAHGGTIDKYIGDAVMALFGAPIPSADAPAQAIRAALAMQSHTQKMNVPGDPSGRLRARFGISTGTAVVGNLGSAQRVEYTSIGDSVNIAARLEGFARPNEICADKVTIEKAGETFAVQEIGTIDVKNRYQPVSVFKVIADMVSSDEEFDTLESQALSTSE